ncbi:MAG: 1-acyl-sn-glycerol-3-phosphate acyltransferase [Anaerolineales bacterium]|nr:1-acyl-sn-glycerol-3-phosphate acyltransferase [Anaerolineales bacterium]
MSLYLNFVNGAARFGLEIMCKIDKTDFHKFPENGPLIAYTNHIGMLEVPIMFTGLQPRPLTALAKVESWNGWLLRWIFNLWGIIPIHRGEADMVATKKALEAITRGGILGMFPEGTRNRDGKLLRAHPGVVLLALKSNAPLLPVAHWGGETFSDNFKHLKRTPFNLRVGEPFYLDARGEKVDKHVRQQMVDEMMYKIAVLLPPEYRGAYTDLENATEKYLRPAKLHHLKTSPLTKLSPMPG